jgi:hypothetical protein
MMDKSKVDMWMMVRPTVTMKALIPIDNKDGNGDPILDSLQGIPLFEDGDGAKYVPMRI